MLTRETFTGPWAGLAVPWTDDEKFDEAAYRRDVARCCRAGVPGVYSSGTTGEFYAMEFDEFQAVTKALVEECHAHSKPAMVGCTSTYTLGTQRRAEYAASLGADAIQLALPFWMEVRDQEVVEFFKDVASAAPQTSLSIYETQRAKKVLTIQQHRDIKSEVPSYMMVKANSKTVGCTTEGCKALSEFVNVFVDELYWAELGPAGANGASSSWVYRGPKFILSLWDSLKRKDFPAVQTACKRLEIMHQFTSDQFDQRGMTDTGFDRLMGLACGFLEIDLRGRKPYPCANPQDVHIIRQWCRQNFPEMLEGLEKE